MTVPPWSSGSVLDHRSLPPVFESRRGHIWRLFHLPLRLITFGSRSAHLAYPVHESAVKHQSSSTIKTSIIIDVLFLHLTWFYYLLENNISLAVRTMWWCLAELILIYAVACWRHLIGINHYVYTSLQTTKKKKTRKLRGHVSHGKGRVGMYSWLDKLLVLQINNLLHLVCQYKTIKKLHLAQGVGGRTFRCGRSIDAIHAVG